MLSSSCYVLYIVEHGTCVGLAEQCLAPVPLSLHCVLLHCCTVAICN